MADKAAIFFKFIFLLVHPCDRNDNGGCNQICNKDGDDVQCGCAAGFKFADNDNKTCVISKYW